MVEMAYLKYNMYLTTATDWMYTYNTYSMYAL